MKHYLFIIFPLILMCIAYGHVEVGIKHQHHGARNVGHSKEHSDHKEAARHNEHKISHKNRHNHHALHRHVHSHAGAKARCDGPTCNDRNSTHTGSKGSPYNFLYNSKYTLLALESNSTVVAVIIDYSSGICLVLDGKSEEAALVDPENNVVVVIDKGSPLSWAASRQSFTDFFASVTTEALKKAEQEDKTNGHIISINNVPSSVQKLIGHVLAGLGEEEALNDPVRYLISLSKRVTKEKKIFAILVVDSGQVITSLNLKQLICVLEGLAQLLATCESNSAQVPKLDLADILAANSGTEAFLNVLKQLGTNIDLTKVFGNGLDSIEIFFSFAVKFSAGSTKGIDGINKVIYVVLEFISGRAHPGEIIQVFKVFMTTDGITIDFKQIVGIYRSISALLQRQEKSPALATFLRGLEEGNLVYKSINISSIIHAFVHLRPWNAIRTIIGIFIQLGLGFPDAFLHVVHLLPNLREFGAFGRIPGIDQHQIPINSDAFQALLRNANFTQAISSGCPFTDALRNVPIFNTIIGIFSQYSNGTKALNSFFGPSSPGLSKFLNIFQEIQNGNTGFQSIIKQIENGIAPIFSHGVPFTLPNFLGSSATTSPSGSSDATKDSTENHEPITFPGGPWGHGPVVFPPGFSLPPLGPGPVILPPKTLLPIDPGTETSPTSTQATSSDDSEIQFSDIPIGDNSDGLPNARNIKLQSKHQKRENKKDTKAHHH